MKNLRGTRVLLWLPRVLAIVWAVYLSTFAVAAALTQDMEYFEMSRTFMTHLIPSFCILVILFIGWQRDGLAALGFLFTGTAYFVALSGCRNAPAVFLLCVPSLGLSLAFFARMRLRQDLHRDNKETSTTPTEGNL